MELDVGVFNEQLSACGGMGQNCLWSRAFLCPCRNTLTGAARVGCPNCGGKGVIWAAPLAAWAGVSGMKVQREWAAFGLWESGDVVLSVPSDSPLYVAGETDRIIMTDSSEPFSLTPTRTGREIVAPHIISVDRVFWLDPATQEIVDGDVPDITGDGILTWPAGTTAPPMGLQYSITGRRRPEYFLFKDMPSDRAHYGGMQLPRKVALRKFDLFGK